MTRRGSPRGLVGLAAVCGACCAVSGCASAPPDGARLGQNTASAGSAATPGTAENTAGGPTFDTGVAGGTGQVVPPPVPASAMFTPEVASTPTATDTLTLLGVLANHGPDCTVTASPAAPGVTRGVLDVALRQDYLAWVLAGLTSTPELAANAAASDNRVVMAAVEVNLTDDEGAVADGHYVAFLTGFIDIPTADTMSFGTVQATLVSPTVAAALRTELAGLGPEARRSLTARVQVFAETFNGTPVSSGELSFPVDVCYGCLVDFPAEALTEDASGTSTCANGVAGAATADPATADPDNAPCALGQDTAVDCRLCTSTVDACAAPASAPLAPQ